MGVLVSNIRLILTDKTTSGKGELLLTYLKLKLKYVLFERILKRNITDDQVFGFKLRFFNYVTFISLFEEIFIHKEYYFDSNAKCPFIIDCGANIGIALIYFKKRYPLSRIIAFEPDVKTFKILKSNVETNNLKNVKLFNKAVYNSEGSINFYYDPSCSGSLVMSTRKERLSKACEKVGSVLLSNYIREDVDFLKMDIEGAEDLVIQELSVRNKLKFVREMVIEYHHHIDSAVDNFSKMLNLLEKNGFGYQIGASLGTQYCKGKFQNILIYVYLKR